MRERVKPDNGHGGYALVEIIMSIGILAIVGLYAVELFVLAGTTQSRASDLDAACLITQTAIEEARAGKVFTGIKYYSGNWDEIYDFSGDGFTLSALQMDTSPKTYSVSVYKNGKYVYFNGVDKNAGEPLFSLSVTLFEEENAG